MKIEFLSKITIKSLVMWKEQNFRFRDFNAL